mmetsp:Transcript_10534/g.14835  ORF Transcript_10534/g.14835 Transcript_10534/m.14835 type:complete len:166 (+) Transcript_10534:3-500(+)
MSLDIQTREAPGLFAFSKASTADSFTQGAVLGSISEAMHIKANPNDQAYKTMLHRRAQEGNNAGNRSILPAHAGCDTWDRSIPEEARALDRAQRADHAANTAYVPPDPKATTKRALVAMSKEVREEALGSSGPVSESEKLRTAKTWGPGLGATTAPMFKRSRLQA